MSSGVASARTAAIRSRLALRDRVADSWFQVSASRESSMLSILPVAVRSATTSRRPAVKAILAGMTAVPADLLPKLPSAAEDSAVNERFGRGSVGHHGYREAVNTAKRRPPCGERRSRLTRSQELVSRDSVVGAANSSSEVSSLGACSDSVSASRSSVSPTSSSAGASSVTSSSASSSVASTGSAGAGSFAAAGAGSSTVGGAGSSSAVTGTGSSPAAGTGSSPAAGTGSSPAAGTGSSAAAGTGSSAAAGTGSSAAAGAAEAGAALRAAFFAGAFLAGLTLLAFAFLLSSTDSVTSSITTIGALSPLRGPTLVIRV